MRQETACLTGSQVIWDPHLSNQSRAIWILSCNDKDCSLDRYKNVFEAIASVKLGVHFTPPMNDNLKNILLVFIHL